MRGIKVAMAMLVFLVLAGVTVEAVHRPLGTHSDGVAALTDSGTAKGYSSSAVSARRAERQQRQCWDAYEDGTSAASGPTTAFIQSFIELGSGSENLTSIEQVRSLCEAAKEYENSGGATLLNSEQRRGCEALSNVGTVPDLHSGFDINLYGPLWNAFPKMAGALFGRSIFSGCKCEACVYSLDTLIMYLDEDTLGFFNENDINRVLMDRFCYGLKWMYRSACHHIMSDYYPQVVDMLQKYLTGWDVCRHLRFCPWALTNNQQVQQG